MGCSHRRATILHELHTQQPQWQQHWSLWYEKNAERISTVLLTKRLLSVQTSPFVLHSVVLMVLVSNVLKDSASAISIPLCFSFPLHKGELQRSCSRTVAEKVSEQCQLACHCRRYPPLPPPPPPPPPPRLLGTTGNNPSLHSQVSHLSGSRIVCLTLSLLSPHSRISFQARHRCQVTEETVLKCFLLRTGGEMYHQSSETYLWVPMLRRSFYTCASVRVIEPAGCWQLNTRLIYAGSNLGEYPAACEIHACWAAKHSGSLVGFPPEDPWLKHRWVN